MTIKIKLKIFAVLVLSAIIMMAGTACGADPQKIFFDKFKQSLLDTATVSKDLSSMQTQILFDPSKETDSTSSYSEKIVTEISNPGESADKIKFINETLYNASNGDASLTVSVGVGNENAQSGGVYFIGNNMFIKRGNTDKKMINYTLPEDIAKSMSDIMPANRLDMIIANKIKSSDTNSWNTEIDSFFKKLSENTEKEDYIQENETKSVLAKEQELNDIILKLKGQSAVMITTDFLTLLQKNNDIAGVYEGMASDNSGTSALDNALNSIQNLSDSEVENTELTIKIQSVGDKVLGFELTVITNEKTLTLINNNIKNGYEQQQEIKLINFDNSGLAAYYENISQGEDKYKGSMTFANFAKGETKKDNISAQWDSVKTDKTYSSDYSYNATVYYNDDGDEEMYVVGGNMKWSQNETNGGNIEGSGNGNITLTLGKEKSKLSMGMTLNKNYSEANVNAPEFIQSAGISVNNSDALVAALDIDKNEYLKMNSALRAISVIVLLLI